jgi:hypothetical protein
MSEFKKEIAVKGAIALVAILGLAFTATLLSTSGGLTTTHYSVNYSTVVLSKTVTSVLTLTHTDLISAATVTINHPTSTGGGGDAALLLGIVAAEDVSCTISDGVCTMDVVNSGNVPGTDIVIMGCNQLLVVSQTSNTTTWKDFPGKIVGEVISLPENTTAKVTCAVPLSEHTPNLDINGTSVSGTLDVELVNWFGSFPPGSQTGIDYGSTWV